MHAYNLGLRSLAKWSRWHGFLPREFFRFSQRLRAWRLSPYRNSLQSISVCHLMRTRRMLPRLYAGSTTLGADTPRAFVNRLPSCHFPG